MNAPVIWIIAPAIISGILYLFRMRLPLVRLLGITTALLLALLAWRLPLGTTINLGSLPWLPQLFIRDSMVVMGRQFILDNPSRSILVIIYLGSAIWFIGSTVAGTSRLFIPLGLGIAALLTATISVKPFLYAALFIEIAVLFCIPILSPPGRPVSGGVLRFLTFQTIGMIILLLIGSILGSAQPFPVQIIVKPQVSILLAIGFAMVIGVFPFNFWIQMVGEESHPFSAAFVFFTLPQILTIFTFNVLTQPSWIQLAPQAMEFLSLLGVAMIIGGGIWSIFQNHLGRILGFAVVTEIGLSVLTLRQLIQNISGSEISTLSALENIPYINVIFVQFLPYGLNLALWALSLSVILAKSKSLDFDSIKGIARFAPIATIGIGLAHLSIAGYPLLAGYPVRVALGAGFAQNDPIYAIAPLAGYAGLMFSAVRSQVTLNTIAGFVPWRLSENRLQIFLIISGCILLILMGIFFGVLVAGLTAILPGFTHTAP